MLAPPLLLLSLLLLLAAAGVVLTCGVFRLLPGLQQLTVEPGAVRRLQQRLPQGFQQALPLPQAHRRPQR